MGADADATTAAANQTSARKKAVNFFFPIMIWGPIATAPWVLNCSDRRGHVQYCGQVAVSVSVKDRASAKGAPDHAIEPCAAGLTVPAWFDPLRIDLLNVYRLDMVYDFARWQTTDVGMMDGQKRHVS